MTTTFLLGRAPIDTTKNVLRFFFSPLHFGKTIATNTTDTFFKIIGTSTEDVPSQIENGEREDSVYDMACSNCDISSIVYYYTELRSETKRLLKNFALKNKMTVDCSNPSDPSDVMVLAAAFRNIDKQSVLIKSPESTASAKALKDYKVSMEQLSVLMKRFRLDEGDIDVFKTYFKILEAPKNLTDIKSDMIRYDQYISPQFRFGFGGSDYNRKKVYDMLSDNSDIYIHYIDDDFNFTSIDPQGIVEGFGAEVVWAIVVNDKEKKITVVFRGSINANDWKTNVQICMTDFKLPGFTSKNDKGESKTYGRVHDGFYKYLFEETKAGANGSTKSKGEEIIGMLKGDFFDKDQYKDYSLYITGHSLGGALSTMLSFRAAAFNEFKMVTNVSFASPFVGNQEFRDDFYDLERKRKIRHLRISNYQDCVPLIPTFTPPFPKLDIEFFKHVGMNIRLYAGGDFLAPSYRRYYPKMNSIPDAVRNTMNANILLGLSVGVIEKHLLPEYTKRLQNEETVEELKKITLDGLYANKDITGWDYLE